MKSEKLVNDIKKTQNLALFGVFFFDTISIAKISICVHTACGGKNK
jgi:hypothetical protein